MTHLGNGYRAYSPALRRFTCPDSESPFGGGGINPYVYFNLAFDLYKGRTEEFVADKLDELISSLGTSLDIPLYRGLPQKVVGEVGGLVKEKRFTAASTNLDVAEKFAEQSMGNRVIEIVGGRPLKIPNVFQKPGGNEFEYLYARNTQFRVSYNYDTGMIKYTAIT